MDQNDSYPYNYAMYMIVAVASNAIIYINYALTHNFDIYMSTSDISNSILYKLTVTASKFVSNKSDSSPSNAVSGSYTTADVNGAMSLICTVYLN